MSQSCCPNNPKVVGASRQAVAARRHKPQRVLFAYISRRRFCYCSARICSIYGDLPMRLSPWRKTSIAILSVAILNMGLAGAAQAAIVDTSALVTTDREADLGTVRAQLDRAEVRAKFQDRSEERRVGKECQST